MVSWCFNAPGLIRGIDIDSYEDYDSLYIMGADKLVALSRYGIFNSSFATCLGFIVRYSARVWLHLQKVCVMV